MEVYEQLLSKNGMATIKLSKELLKYQIGERIPTVSEFSVSLDLVRGTVQNAMKNLTDSKAIEVESRGHMGTFLIRKNMKLLLEFSGNKTLVGAMPLPYSKRYEGLASGLITAMENSYNIPINMAYMRGAMNRVSMLFQKRYDFAVISRFAAEEFIKKGENIEIVIGFGSNSYLSNHVIMFHDPKAKEIKDGMRIGIDVTSVDQKVLTEKVCEGKKVEYVSTEYSCLIEKIVSGEIDATVMNVDETVDKKMKINTQMIPNISTDNTEAVIVVSKDEDEFAYVLKELIDINTVLTIQKAVMEGTITPSY